ncbi:MAG TPA: hypothetical protein PKW90_17100 [Myxococcota bacterium]|nr:hypothetical protein [Myxococcota bacterium]
MPPPSPYPSRTRTYAAGDQVASADLNAIQDGIIDCSDAIDALDARMATAISASINMGEATPPDQGGAPELRGVEVSTNGTTAVIIDSTVDWRDRWITVTAYPISTRPGDAGDSNLQFSRATHIKGDGVFYTGSGGTSYNFQFVPTADIVEIYADSSTGALKMVKNANADGTQTFLMNFTGSPVQNHY